MKRLVFPVIIAALSICHNASAQSPSRIYMPRIPNTVLTSSEKSEAVNGAVAGSSMANGGYYGGADQYGFGSNNCGCNSGGCCDNAWDGYSRGCGIHGHFGKHHGKCNSCAPVGCGGCAGGCFGNSFAGGCGGCFGGCGGCGGHHALGAKLHHFGKSCCAGFAQHCKGLFHGSGMFYGCDSGCGCASGGNVMNSDKHNHSNMSAPPAPPAEPVPAADASPMSPPVPEKSAQRRTYARPNGAFPASW